MSHRRNSLSGGARLPDVPTSGTARPRPSKAVSIDVPDGRVNEHLRNEDRNAKYSNFASGDFIQRLDEKCDNLENGPLAQTARANIQRAAEVIDEHVLKKVRLPDEVQVYLHDLEQKPAVRAVKGRVQAAYSYVEPIGEKILSRVNSTDEDPVEFVIPPQLERCESRGSYTSSIVRPPSRRLDFDSHQGSLDIQQYQPLADIPTIEVSAIDHIEVKERERKPSILSQLSVRSYGRKSSDQISLASAADSERFYELVRPNTFYATVPSPLPKPRHKRGKGKEVADEHTSKDTTRLLLGQSSSECEGSESIKSIKPEGPNGTRKVTFNDKTKSQDGSGLKRQQSSSVGNKKKLQRQVSVDQEYNDQDDVPGENTPLVPKIQKIRGLSEEQLREQVIDGRQTVVCINGKTYIVSHPSQEEDEKKETYGGASELFGDSASSHWKTVAGIYRLE